MYSFFFQNDWIVLDNFVRTHERTIVPQERRPALLECQFFLNTKLLRKFLEFYLQKFGNGGIYDIYLGSRN